MIEDVVEGCAGEREREKERERKGWGRGIVG